MPWKVTKGGGSCSADQFAVLNTQTGATKGCHATRKKANKQLAALNANVSEAPMTETTIVETTALDGAPIQEAESGGRMLVQIITPGWGSSGYYSSEVLEAAAGAQVFPAGLHMYLDHPSTSEQADRPERSVRDLAAVLTEDAQWTGHALTAHARVFGPYREALAEMHDAIGVSIRATATAAEGEAEGRKGPVITELHEGLSVDFVTHAGRGGQVLQILESARELEQREALPGGHTMDSLRGALRDAVQAAHGKTDAWVFVRDFTDETAYFDVDSADASVTYQQGFTADDNGAVTLQDSPVRVQPRIQYVPVEADEGREDTETTDPAEGSVEPPAAEPAEESSQEVPEMDGNQGASGGALTPRQLMEQRDASQRRQIAELQARDRARSLIGETMADAWLTPSTATRLTEELMRDLPLVNDQLDEAALRDRALAARDRAETEVAEALQAAGVGQPRALGHTAGGQDAAGTNLDERLESAFRGMGLSESVAKTAAKGR